MSFKNLPIAIVLCCCFVLDLNTLTAQNPSYQESFSGIRKVNIDLIIGDLQVRPSENNEVQVTGYFDQEKLKAMVDVSGSKLTVKEKTIRERNNGDIDSKWILLVPKDTKIESNAATGNVSIQDYDGQMKGNSGTGHFKIMNSNGDFDLNSGTGNVELNSCEGNMKLNTGTGNVFLTNFSGHVDANSGTGNVALRDSKGGFLGNSGTGNVSASGLSITDASSFNSGTGSTKLVANASITADVSINSGTGNAKLDFDNNDFQGTLTMACNKKRGKIQSNFKFDEEWIGDGNNDNTLYKEKKFGSQDINIKVSTGTGRASAQ